MSDGLFVKFSISFRHHSFSTTQNTMPSVTLGRKRPLDAIVTDGARQNKKVKFTDDGEAVVVKSATPTTTHSSKVKPDYSKVTKRSDRNDGASTKDTHASMLIAEDIDFPRGGGSSLTPLEHKETRAEGVREAEMEIFKVSNSALSHPFVHLTRFMAGE